MSVAFIGLGTMGRPMAERILRSGEQVNCHRVKDASRYLLELGGNEAATAADAVPDTEFVVLMLPDTPQVEGVLFGEDGVIDALRPGSVVIDMSSISPVATRQFAERVEAVGASYLDAPVSGGEIGAREGTLSIMVGGPEAVFERALPLLQKMGKNITRVGEVGAGQVCKVANQVIVGLTIEAVSEAFLLARRAGVDLGKVRDALMGGFASSRILEIHGKRMIDGVFDPVFTLRLHRKDLNIATDAARSLEIALPNTAATAQLMNAALAQGLGEKDHSALFAALSAWSPVTGD
ncbi:2-hydroxy-3-oxopropionate reductase [Devosia nitrariae]|uniref:2-hydroxy-3-oxopropionate reductase n=1 Tax=Devosia nitrariae TaxID=2071872 RepID=A0ABQ5W4Z2_9HYPH|nr:2-hydroxy-3-oxopropionate reductase [Devosia nitrariae]GLQ54736.1 2-hydroxy-3-oxopropionate reductase [Devosia nitrariae]